MTTERGELRIALWQCEPRPAVPETNLDRLDAAAADAARRGADLIVTPEMVIPGYDIGAGRARELADPPDGPIARRVGVIAGRHRIAILYGCAELASDGSVYNAIRLVDAAGTATATHHKTHLFGQLDRRMFAPGSARPPVVDCAGWRLGLLTCYEVEFPELVRSLSVRGADVVCVPTANMIEYDIVQDVLVRARAVESQVFVAYANHCGSENDLVYGGRSEIVSPGGAVVASAGRSPDLVIADLSRAALDDSRRRFPYLDDRRPDLYT
ncbi:carbon-nitrogen hydrolase family protein [Gordonia sp. OPL2]|uniref:carbon-nitrogen hydrolase family protein n=1 Tax=Gordonia sp. OPL2 TaxID=2486274 RepID=UPI0016552F99|nr:carbon-nitrogen hydrolase family protein [Gordonia sp. OPL2]ROZ88659.1 carbon-nitrogen hydrolase [Gordonia sp. OPL2]